VLRIVSALGKDSVFYIESIQPRVDFRIDENLFGQSVDVFCQSVESLLNGFGLFGLEGIAALNTRSCS
jgi:hypothetical protein